SQLRGLAGCTGIYPEFCATLRIEAAIFRVSKCAHQKEKVGCGVAAEHIFAVFAGLFSLETAQKIAALGERGDQRDRGDTTILLCGQKHARIARVDWKRQHSPAELCQAGERTRL